MKGYYRDAVLHALTDLAALGLADKETKELGPFRHACLGAYYTLLATAAANAPPVQFCDLEPDRRRIDWVEGQWEEIGLWHPRTFFNGPVWTTFDEHGNAVVTRGRAVCFVSEMGARLSKVDEVRDTSRSALGIPKASPKLSTICFRKRMRRTLMSRETVAELLRLVANGEELAWARSMRRATATATRVQRPWLCVSGSTLMSCASDRSGSAKAASPGRAWQDLQPWRPKLE